MAPVMPRRNGRRAGGPATDLAAAAHINSSQRVTPAGYASSVENPLARMQGWASKHQVRKPWQSWPTPAVAGKVSKSPATFILNNFLATRALLNNT